ncbi:MAG: CAP domain-containing protein, partial [Patescibacteria group bacterium]
MSYEQRSPKGLSRLQRVAFTLMTSLVLLTFVGTNLHTLLWQSSDWLVSTILPATVVDLTNQERATNAAPPLRRSALLDQAAAQKAEHMVREGYFAHFSPDGVSPWHWFGEVGYRYAHAGENLAVHFTDSSAMVDAWMQSPTHRENIVNAQYTEIGIGTATGTFEGYRTVFVVQLFATPAAPAASATTEAGATTRASQSATPQ